MADSGSLEKCLDACYRYLSYRPRSEAEIRLWLERRGFSPEVREKAIAKLRELDLSDDLAFAQFWRDNRLSYRPKSKRLIERELKEKRVAEEIIEQVTNGINDEEVAYELGLRRMPVLAHLDYPDFCRRLSNYLAYRGFSQGLIRRTVALLWQERRKR